MSPLATALSRALLAAALSAPLASRCALLAPLPELAPTPASTATEAPPLNPSPTADVARAEAQAAFAAMRRAALPWAGKRMGGDEVAGATEPPEATVPPAAGCPGIAVRAGAQLAVDGRTFVFFGANAHYLVDAAFEEARVEPLLAEMAQRGVNVVRVFYFPYHDPERMQRLLDAGARQGIRFILTLEDNVFRGVGWFSDKAAQAAYEAHLDRTVQRFKDRPEVLMWELVNEPNCGEGRFDDDCLSTIRGWIGERAARVAALDPCRVVSTGMIGDGNYENEQKSYRMAHRKDGVGIVSVHRRSTDRSTAELELAADEDLPIFYGEIYDVAYSDGCEPLDGDRSPAARAERVKDDLRDAVEAGVDGYLLWDYAADDYCSKFGFAADDPLWEKLRQTEGLPPAVPWR